MKWRVFLVCSVLAVVSFLSFSLVVYADDSIVRGFKTDTTLELGLIVAIEKNIKGTVEPVPSSDPNRIYGVVIDPYGAPLIVRQKDEQTFVATGGDYPVLVSNENGVINPGDYISVSSIAGVGAKASNQSTVIGQAAESFNGESNVITTTSDGHALGSIVVSIVPGKNPLDNNDVAIPAPLKRFGEAIAGKNVSASRIYAALIVFIVTGIIALGVLWIGIRSGMIAIGRNPLSKSSIMNSLLQIIVTAVLVFIVGIFAVYLLLRL